MNVTKKSFGRILEKNSHDRTVLSYWFLLSEFTSIKLDFQLPF